ncbi:MAG TPA: methyltransferase domain-containing protein [Flavipsychrobacter sp.]|nr:methyltransferase domain-containing protein [Flavipsychrobacter sp.]
MSHISLKRPITSYAKVRHFVSILRRGKKWQVNNKLANKKYLDVGCGHNADKTFVNLDYEWLPNVDIVWDITAKPYPFPDNRFEGIYTEHCLEHIPFEHCDKNIKEFYRMLKPGGIVRIIVPDGEKYVNWYTRKKQGENVKMPDEEYYISPMHRINGIFRNHGHLFIYDFDTLRILMEKNGFKNVRKCDYLQGANSDLFHDTEMRAVESVYVEGEK